MPWTADKGPVDVTRELADVVKEWIYESSHPGCLPVGFGLRVLCTKVVEIPRSAVFIPCVFAIPVNNTNLSPPLTL